MLTRTLLVVAASLAVLVAGVFAVIYRFDSPVPWDDVFLISAVGLVFLLVEGWMTYVVLKRFPGGRWAPGIVMAAAAGVLYGWNDYYYHAGVEIYLKDRAGVQLGDIEVRLQNGVELSTRSHSDSPATFRHIRPGYYTLFIPATQGYSEYKQGLHLDQKRQFVYVTLERNDIAR